MLITNLQYTYKFSAVYHRAGSNSKANGEFSMGIKRCPN